MRALPVVFAIALLVGFWSLFAIIAGCSHTVELAMRVPPGVKCHKVASDIVQMADATKPHWCKDAEAKAREEESCKLAYPDGIDFGCHEVAP